MGKAHRYHTHGCFFFSLKYALCACEVNGFPLKEPDNKDICVFFFFFLRGRWEGGGADLGGHVSFCVTKHCQ